MTYGSLVWIGVALACGACTTGEVDHKLAEQGQRIDALERVQKEQAELIEQEKAMRQKNEKAWKDLNDKVRDASAQGAERF
jgi:hypothetical protein